MINKRYVLLGTLYLLSITGIIAQPNTWKKKNDFPGGARSCASAVTIGNKIYMGLGFSTSGSKKDWWEYNPLSDTWLQKATFPGAARGHAAELALNGKVYVGLGSGDCSTCDYADWYEYDPQNDTWTKKADFLGGKRYSPVSFTVNGRAFVGTGGALTGLNGYKGDMYEYDPVQDKWTKKNDIGGSPRYSAVYFVANNKAYVCTGQDASQGGGSWNRKELFEYNDANDTWVQKADFPGVGRDFASGFGIGNYGYVGIGWGNESPYKEDFYEYDPATNTWQARADFGGGKARNAAYTSCNGKGYFITFSSYVYDPNDQINQHKYPNSTEVWEYEPATTTGISLMVSNNNWLVYPNPVNGPNLFLQSNETVTPGANVQITNLLGEVIIVSTIPGGTSTMAIPIAELANGIYWLTIKNGEKTIQEKIVVAR